MKKMVMPNWVLYVWIGGAVVGMPGVSYLKTTRILDDIVADVSFWTAAAFFLIGLFFSFLNSREGHKKLDSIETKLDSMDGKLDEIRNALVGDPVERIKPDYKRDDIKSTLEDLPERIAKAMVKEMEKSFPGLKHLPVPDDPSQDGKISHNRTD